MKHLMDLLSGRGWTVASHAHTIMATNYRESVAIQYIPRNNAHPEPYYSIFFWSHEGYKTKGPTDLDGAENYLKTEVLT